MSILYKDALEILIFKCNQLTTHEFALLMKIKKA